MEKNYSPLVLSHYRNPRNFGKLKKPTHTAEVINSLCGDEIKVYLQIQDNKIKDLSYEACGCALSIAAASILSEKIKGRSIKEIKKIDKSCLEKLLGVRVSKARGGCIMLALDAIENSFVLKQKPT